MNLRFDVFNEFNDKVVLITGASTGIGAAVAKGFGEAGASVVVHYNRSREAAEGVVSAIIAAGGKARAVRADVLDRAAVRKMIEEVLEESGRIDVLVNNAGALVARKLLAEATDELYDEVMELNFGSVFQACRAVVPAMQRQGGGAIINLTSIAARTGGGQGSILYAASKGAISTFTRGLARELAPYNVRVNAVSPGVILTPFHERYTPPEVLEGFKAAIPMGRLGEPEECVGPVLFLASSYSSYITGQVLEVNGGQLMG
jgi:3-oxoacyl-[acyl-carrier protein] reductase